MLTSSLNENHSCDLHCLLEIFYSLIMQKALIYSDWNYHRIDLYAAFICGSSVFHVLTNWIVHWFIRDQFLMCFRAINPALCALLSLPPFANITTHCRSFCGDWKHPGISPILSNLCPGVSCWLAIRFTRKAKVRWVFFWGFSSLLRLGYRWYSEPRF